MLKRILVPVMVFAVAYLVMPVNSYAQNKYEGVKVCGICHKTAKAGEQLKHWEGSKHAQAFKTLQTEEAKKYSPDMDATKNPKCLKCHTTGYGEDAKMFGAKFNIEDGVQCEACHGPGSGYKSMKIMKDKAAAIKAGLASHDKKSDYCVGCHNSESPTFKGFDFDKMFAKIAHPIPKG